MANCEELPQEILELIARRLVIEDFLAFRGVCTSWRSAAAKETYNTKSKAPWLMNYVDNQRAEFCSPPTWRIYPMRVPGSHVRTFSAPGWILASRGDREYHIFNPLSRVSIELPALKKLRRKSRLSVQLNGPKRLKCRHPRINRIALSSGPSSSRSYIVMIHIHESLGPLGFAFHRSEEDAWMAVSPAMHLRRSTVLQLIFYDGLFVALDAAKQIMTFNERKRRMESRLILGQNIFEGHPYLVECSGSLMAAWTIWGEGYGPVKRIRVFKVDLEKGTDEEVKSLGNASLFLNGNSSFSVEFNAESFLLGIKPNHVYFVDNVDEKKKSYSRDNGEVGTYLVATSCHDYAATWFQPDFTTFL
ncbi:uncharacterized protein LOC104446717 [Eucalyptus grandis]|uniref:uncharacterized protein LOC104446717 n=1 Tax=Eucalyptus grandis TaxID=71139 RepID=UPI00192E7E8C|nr:uncharacterized protein LOC104446717 [Eucalyptus grandis]